MITRRRTEHERARCRIRKKYGLKGRFIAFHAADVGARVTPTRPGKVRWKW